tara:strand:- start:1172 stop:1531 length:360 start_codon:yes stop_codon:yes gene_type:complete
VVEEELEELSEEVVEEELEVLTELSDTWFGDKGLESSSLEHAISTRSNNEVKPTITENFLYFKKIKNTNKELRDTKNKNNINHPFAFVIFSSDVFFELNNSLFVLFSSNALDDLFNINI